MLAEHGRAKHKRWKHKKRYKINVVHKQPRLKISLGYNYFWRNWYFGYHLWNKHQSKNIFVVNKDVIRNIETIDFQGATSLHQIYISEWLKGQEPNDLMRDLGMYLQ